MQEDNMKIYEVKEYRGYEYVSIEHKLEDFENYTPYLHYWWCGYVKLNPGSRFINSDYNDIPVECHGNLTFKGHLQGMPEGMWIGFDTNHYMDNMNVKNQEFVETECKKIIEQLIGLESE